MGDTFTWLGGSLSAVSSWSQPDPNNPTVPTSGSTANIAGTGTVIGSVAPGEAIVSGTFTLDGSIVSANETHMGGGTLTIVSGANFGGAGMALNGGTIVQTGGAVSATFTFEIDAGGSYQFNGGTIDSPGSELIGATGSGTMSQSAGTNTAKNLQIYSGLYTMTAGALNVGDQNEYIGDRSGETGTLTQSGGKHTIDGSLQVGYNGTGTYNLSGGSLKATSEFIGQNSTGTVMQTGGTTTLSDRVVLGINITNGAAGTGSYTLGGNASLNVGVIFVGSDPSCHGTFNFDTAKGDKAKLTISGEQGLPGLIVGGQGIGTFTMGGGSVSTTLAVGYHLGSKGVLNLKDGVLSSTSEIVGAAENGTFNQSGGTNTLSGASALQLGTIDGSTGTYRLSSSQATIQGGGEAIGVAAKGAFIQTSGTNLISVTEMLDLGVTAFGNGTYKLASGTLKADKEVIGDGGLGTFTQTGGANTVDGQVIVGNQSGAIGDYTISGGTLTVEGSDGAIILGAETGATGQLTISNVTVNTPTLEVGEHGKGVLTVNANGVLDVAQSITLDKHSTLDTLAGSVVVGTETRVVGTVVVASGAVLSGSGTITGNLKADPGARVVAMGGTLKIDGAVDGGGELKIGNNATLVVAHTISDDVLFTNTSETLELGTPNGMIGKIRAMTVGDKLVLDGVTATAADVQDGTLTVTLANDKTLTFDVTGNFASTKFAISVNSGDSALTLVSAKVQVAGGTVMYHDGADESAPAAAQNVVEHGILAIDARGRVEAHAGGGFELHIPQDHLFAATDFI